MSFLSPVSLDERYTKREGQILITGVQALVRLMLLQAERDRRAGLNTSGYVSGYRGSPLGTVDLAFARAGALPGDYGIIVKPAVNEELAATAIAGTQQLAQSPGARVQGVFSLWYGKAPGLDRAADAIRHGNAQGSAARGGVVLAVGDDHMAKSSSIVCYSEETLAALQVPVFYPADPHEIVVYGLHGFAIGRHTGAWAALKIVPEVADSTRTVPTGELDLSVVLPQIAAPSFGLNNRFPETALEQESTRVEYRLPGAQACVRANGLDRIVSKPNGARIGLVAAGKAWLDLQEGLRLLGLDEARMTSLGIALYKPALIWPLEPTALSEFAAGLATLIVVEEKVGFLENQIKALLYGKPSAPVVVGKVKPTGGPLFPKSGELSPERIAAELAPLLQAATGDAVLATVAERRRADLATQADFAVPPVIRKPFFCSGCPHNRSTVIPEGSRQMAGIGCHGLILQFKPGVASFSQMGGEGMYWVGMAPFTDEPHMFANLGDGTYFHSGILAIRQAVAAKVNITYKLLYNSAVAMTGGQPVDGELTVAALIDQLRAEGVTKIAMVTDDPERYPQGDPVRAKADHVVHRDVIEAVQRELRAIPGVTAIVYEQMCATEKRRLRKRGKLPDPPRFAFINDQVCENCGDCSVVSNCLSVEPVAAKFELKRRINQSTCNKDMSCTNGFCPSFVTVAGGKLRKARPTANLDSMPQLPVPAYVGALRHQRIVVAGIGGTGVVTISALLSMAAHITGRGAAVLDQVGMAQKGGAVASHLHIADDAITALRIPTGEADLLLACDEIVGNTRDVIAAIRPGHTCIVANADIPITGDFTQNRAAVPDASLLARRLASRAGEERFIAFPVIRLSERLLGDAIGSNLMMVGVAYQMGWLALDVAAFTAAIKLNGVGVNMNVAAFTWGRHLAANPQAVFAAAGLVENQAETVDELIAHRAGFLVDYQDQAYADRYRAILARLRAAEGRITKTTALTETAAMSLFRLMAYKDEYEVARLYTDGRFARALADQFEGDVKLTFHLAPPLLARRDKATGHLKKQRYGAWMMGGFRLLAKFKWLRGTALDPFGHTAERRTERALIGEFEQVLAQLAADLSPASLAAAVEIAKLPMSVRGYGHIKARATEAYRRALADKLGTRGTLSSAA